MTANPVTSIAERLYNVRRWIVLPAGGQFCPVEEAERLTRDIAAFFAAL